MPGGAAPQRRISCNPEISGTWLQCCRNRHQEIAIVRQHQPDRLPSAGRAADDQRHQRQEVKAAALELPPFGILCAFWILKNGNVLHHPMEFSLSATPRWQQRERQRQNDGGHVVAVNTCSPERPPGESRR